MTPTLSVSTQRGQVQAPAASYNLGVLLAEQGQPDQAEAAFRQAIDSKHPDAAPKAANNLGLLLAEQGRSEQAEAPYRRPIDPDQTSQ